MKKNEMKEERTCPLCGGVFRATPATSRKYPNLLICPDCGIKEALESLGISSDDQDKILKIIKNATI